LAVSCPMENWIIGGRPDDFYAVPVMCNK